jgi:hypothetical protein
VSPLPCHAASCGACTPPPPPPPSPPAPTCQVRPGLILKDQLYSRPKTAYGDAWHNNNSNCYAGDAYMWVKADNVEICARPTDCTNAKTQEDCTLKAKGTGVQWYVNSHICEWK